MNLKSSLLVCGAVVAAAIIPSAASANATFSISIGNGYSSYPGYGYDDPFGYDGNSNSWRHEQQHEDLDDEHDDAHDQLDEEHARAHAQGLDPWQHAQLHRQLQYQHDYAHYQLDRQHQYQHQLEQWRRRMREYGYYGY